MRSKEKRKAKKEKVNMTFFVFPFSLFLLRLVLPLAGQDEVALPAAGNLSRAERICKHHVEPVHPLDLLDELIPVAHDQLDPVAVGDERKRWNGASQLLRLPAREGKSAVIKRVEEENALSALVVQRDPARHVLQVLAVFDFHFKR